MTAAGKSHLALRICCASTGAATVISGMYLIALVIWRLWNPVPAVLPVPRVLNIVISFTFLAAFLSSGLCWLALSLNDDVWKSTS